MNAGTEPAGSRALIERARAILLKPKEEWPRIAAEQKSQADILTSYVLPLAAIGPVAGFIGAQLFGQGLLFVSIRPSLMTGLVSAVLSFVLFIIGIFVLSFIADWLAPKFGGKSDRLGAFKLVAYGATAAGLAGIFGLIPALGLFGLLGLYSIYLFYTGAGPMLGVPENQQLAYTAVTCVCALVLNMLIGLVVSAIIGIFGLGAMGAGALRDLSGTHDEVTVDIPGVGRIESGKIEAIRKQVENAASGKTRPVDLETLNQFLPERIGAYERVSIQTTSIGNFGSASEGTYRSGTNRFTLSVTDMHAAGAIAGIAGAFGVEHEREDADGYERTRKVDGQMQTEQWNTSTKSGKFGRIVAGRFMVEASGNAQSIDELKAAVAAIDEQALRKAAE
ncbi:MAG: YIP1 family protein [Novosphingobium sp.]|nr:YIP1 family protein [Novosphingobium sp.]